MTLLRSVHTAQWARADRRADPQRSDFATSDTANCRIAAFEADYTPKPTLPRCTELVPGFLPRMALPTSDPNADRQHLSRDPDPPGLRNCSPGCAETHPVRSVQFRN